MFQSLQVVWASGLLVPEQIQVKRELTETLRQILTVVLSFPAASLEIETLDEMMSR